MGVAARSEVRRQKRKMKWAIIRRLQLSAGVSDVSTNCGVRTHVQLAPCGGEARYVYYWRSIACGLRGSDDTVD